MKKASLLRSLGSYYPKRLAESYDHVGLMCGKLKDDIHSFLLCLDYEEEVYELALQLRPDLIISHHPFIFGTKAAVLNRDPLKKELFEKTEQAGLCVYSMHTNFDCGYPSMEGMNDAMVEKLGLQNIRLLEGSLMARGGDLPSPMDVHDFAVYAKEKLGVPYGLLIDEGKKTISTVAIIGGGGWREYEMAQDQGYDIYISGDVPHHGRREIIARKYNYLDLPHEIEHIFMERMEKVLLQIDPTFEIKRIDHEIPPKVV